jgi:hypothetical protein
MAYECQFWDSMTSFKPNALWKAYSEPKYKFFSWLLLHDRVLSADNMVKINWPCNPLCPLCYCLPEATSHLLTQCNFVEATWNLVASHFSLNYDKFRWAEGTKAREKHESGNSIQLLVANLERAKPYDFLSLKSCHPAE